MRRVRHAVVVLGLASLGLASVPARAVDAPAASSRLLAEVAEEAWQFLLERDVALRSRRGLPISRLPSYGEAERVEQVDHARAQLDRLRAVVPADLSADERVTL